MKLPASPRALYSAVSWHVRGLFASEGLRKITFAARDLWQPAEVETRRGIARELATELLPELTIDRDVGYLRLPASALPSLDEVCQIGQAIVSASTTSDGEIAGNKMFSRFRLAKAEQRLALLRVALDRRVLAMVASYFGILPVITEADFYCSFPVSGPWTKSQLWHCDDDAAHVLKIFVYCEDVAPENGPFELIEPITSRSVRKAVGYRYAGRRYRVPDETMEQFVPAGQETAILGPKGSAFVIDTVQCFHRGSRIRAENRRRVAGMVCFAPPNGQVLPRRLVSGSAPLAAFANELTGDLERAVLGMPVTTKWV